jgi:hypothetical protein
MPRPGAPAMRSFRPIPIPIAEPIGRIVASVIAKRHAAVMQKGARQVAARRARTFKTAEPVPAFHAPLSPERMT